MMLDEDTPEHPFVQSQSKVEAPILNEANTLLSVRADLNSAFKSFDYWTDYANQPYTVSIYEYQGFEGMVYKHIKRFCNKYYRKNVREFWDRSHLHHMDLDNAISQFTQEAETNYRWWERPWHRSLPIEKGGERAALYTKGSDHQISKVGPLSIDNTGHFSWDGWDLQFTHKRETSLRNDEIPFINPFLNFLDLNNPLPEEERAFELGISPPIGDIETKPNWSLKSSLNFNVRVDKMLTGSLKGNGTSVQFNLEFVGYYSEQHIPWFVARLECVAKPLKNEYEAGLVLSVLNF